MAGYPLLDVNAHIQGNYLSAITSINSWVWSVPIHVSNQTLIHLEISFPGGIEGPGRLQEFIFHDVELDYPLKPIRMKAAVTSPGVSSAGGAGIVIAREPAPGVRQPISITDKNKYAGMGEQAADDDRMITACRELEAPGLRRRGFDIGIGLTNNDKTWGPGKQWWLESLTAEEQAGFKDAAAFVMGRNNNPELAMIGMGIAEWDPEVAEARFAKISGLYWLGFDIGSALYGDSTMGALGYKTLSPRDERMRNASSEGEHVLLGTREIEAGFNDAMIFHLTRRRP